MGYSFPMEIDKYIHNGTLTIRVVPNASKNDVVEEHNQLKVYIKAVPDKNKANVELIKFFKKKFYEISILKKENINTILRIL